MIAITYSLRQKIYTPWWHWLNHWPLVTLLLLATQHVGYSQIGRYTCGNDSIGQVLWKTNSPTSTATLRALNAAQVQQALDDTTTYSVPVVFIIYHIGEPVGTGSNLADEAVQYTLNLINERYAGIGVNGYRGLDSKIRFKFCKRTQVCNPTTGIVRVDGRSVPGYEANGLNDYSTLSKLAALVPDFIDQSLPSGVLTINIYHRVSGGAFAYYGGAVHMTAPTQNDLNPYNYVPPHEVGHTLQLYHPYDGSSQTSCPADTYNDRVEDTQPQKYQDPYNACDPNAGTFINSCTGLAFGTQLRNLMTFGCDQDRFTPGQIARMRYYLANDYKRLATSDMDKPITPSETPVAVTCQLNTPPAETAYMYGISSFQFNTIVNPSGIWSSRHFDYTCAYLTKVSLGQTVSISVSGYGTFGRVYIDYDSDGSFNESSELVMSFNTTSRYERQTFSQSITIPPTAVVNRILRVRAIFDNGEVAPTACVIPGRENQGFGEVEDYGILVSAPSCVSTKSGSWNDATVWSCGQLPTSLDNVTIMPTHTVLLDSGMPAAVCQNLEVLGTFSMQGSVITINGTQIAVDQENVTTK